MATFKIDITSSQNYATSLASKGIAGEDLAKGSICYLDDDGKYYLASAINTDTKDSELRIAINDILLNEENYLLEQGYFSSISTFTKGLSYYLSETAGHFTNTEYTNGSIIRYIGTAENTSKLRFNPQHSLGFVPEDSANKNIANGYPSLDSNGLLLTSQLTLALFAAASGDYTYEEGDVIIITSDIGDIQHYIYKGGTKTTVSEYSEINSSQIDWSQLVSVPTTIAGYGITDTYTKTEADGKYLLNITDTLDGDLTVTGDLEISGLAGFGNSSPIYKIDLEGSGLITSAFSRQVSASRVGFVNSENAKRYFIRFRRKCK